MNRRNKKAKWTIMKYIEDLDLIIKYADLIRELKAKVDIGSIIEINSIMQKLKIYLPRNGKQSIDTTNFKISQIIYYMFAYRSRTKNKEIVFSPLGNLLLDNKDDIEKKSKIYSSMLFGLPFCHPYNKMHYSFNLFPYRLIFKLLSDVRLNYRLYSDEVFFHVMWIKSIENITYDSLVDTLINFRKLDPYDKYDLFRKYVSQEDVLANALHETNYIFKNLQSADIVKITEGKQIGILRHGGFGRGAVPDYLSNEERELIKYTGKRKYTTSSISLTDKIKPFIFKMLDSYSFIEKPQDLSNKIGSEDYILHLYNFYPKELLNELNLNNKRVQMMLNIAKDINHYSKNSKLGDCYKFEKVLSNAFNEFEDISAKTLGGAGRTDVECIDLIANEKFAIETKSTRKKLAQINAGRLKLHRIKIGAKYTIVVAPYYTPSVYTDIEDTNTILITASSLSNYLYQYIIHSKGGVISYRPLYNIIKSSYGENITSKLNDYVSTNFGIGKTDILS